MEKKNFYRSYLISFFKLLVPALALSFIIRGFVFLPVQVTGNSMEKTVSQGDMVIMEKFSSIKRFDVIVFKLPGEGIFIKRVIGLPGDSIQYENDQLFINGEPIAEPFLAGNLKKDHEVAPYTTDFTLNELIAESKVPQESYFVLGDNRRMSKDSRSFGVIESKYILGKAQIVYYPFQHIKFIPR